MPIFDDNEEDYLVAPQWVKFFQALWLKSTEHMSAEQRGWYMQMLATSADNTELPGYIEGDEESMMQTAKFTRLSSDVQILIEHGVEIPQNVIEILNNRRKKQWLSVGKKFKASKAHPGYVHNKRMLSVVKEAHRSRHARVVAGKARAASAAKNHEQLMLSKELTATTPAAPPENPQHLATNNDSTLAKNGFSKSKTQTLPGLELDETIPAYAELTIENRKKILPKKEKSNQKRKKGFLDEILQVYEFWKLTMHFDHNRLLTNHRKLKVNARLNEGTTVEEIQLAIQGCSISAWHMGTDPNSPRAYNDLGDDICGSRDKIEKFISIWQNRNNIKAHTGGNNGYESAAARNARINAENQRFLRDSSDSHIDEGADGLQLGADDIN